MQGIKLLKHQFEFVKDIQHRNLGLIAGYAAGKSEAFIYKMLDLASRNVGFTGMLLEPTHTMNRDILIPRIDEILYNLNIKFESRMSPLPEYDIYFKTGSCKVLIRSAENYKRLWGLNLAFVGFDEADTVKKAVNEKIFRMIDSRIRKGNVLQFFVTSTPEGMQQYLYQYFVKSASPDKHYIKGSTYDNPFIDADFIPNLKSKYPPHLIEAYLNGEFVNLNTATVYYAFDRKVNYTERTIKDFHPDSVLHLGTDFNVNHTTTPVCIIEKGITYVVDEIVRQKNTETLIKTTKLKFPNRKIVMYPDSSGKSQHTNASKSDIVLLTDAGLECKYRSTNPFVTDRVNSVNARFKNANNVHSVFININMCPLLVEGLESQAYNDKGEPDKVNDYNHILDALGYFIYFNWPITGRATGKLI